VLGGKVTKCTATRALHFSSGKSRPDPFLPVQQAQCTHRHSNTQCALSKTVKGDLVTYPSASALRSLRINQHLTMQRVQAPKTPV
jgi:hypothetical protein